jgi:hypothetical protein
MNIERPSLDFLTMRQVTSNTSATLPANLLCQKGVLRLLRSNSMDPSSLHNGHLDGSDLY